MSTKVISALVRAWSFGGSTATLKIYASEPFRTSDGTFIKGGKIGSHNTAIDDVTCTVAGGNITIPAVTLYVTDNSVDRPDVLYTAVLYDEDGTLRETLVENFPLPEAISNPTTWSALAILGQTGDVLEEGTFLTSAEIAALYQTALVSGTTLKTINTESLLGAGDITIQGYYKLSSYASFATAVTALGSTKAIIEIDAASTVSTAVTIPSTLKVRPAGGTLTKSGTGTVTFQGYGVDNAESREPLFTGFSAGDVTWNGTVFPSRLSCFLWSDANLDAKLKNAIGAVAGKAVTIVAYPGTIATKVTLTDGLSLHLTKGTYLNTLPAVAVGSETLFVLSDNTRVYGDGMTETFLQESSNDNIRLFYASGVVSNPFSGANENIEISDINFVGNSGTTVFSAYSAILLGNCRNGHVRRCYFDYTHGFAAYIGGFGTAENFPEGCSITDCVMVGLQTQNAGLLSGRNCIIDRNIFILANTATSPALSAIDIEPNSEFDVIENLQITNNIIDARLAQTTVGGIVAQSGGAPYCKNVLIANNTIIGADDFYTEFKDADVTVATDTITITGHGFQTGQMVIPTNSGGALPSPLTSTDYWVIRTDADNFKLATSFALATAGTAVNITSAAGGGTHDFIPRRNLNGAISVIGGDNISVVDNRIKGTSSTALSFTNSVGLFVQGNTATMIGGGGSPGLAVRAVRDSIFADNYLSQSSYTAVSQDNSILESEYSGSITTVSGTPVVTRTTGALPLSWWQGLNVNVNGTYYTVLKTSANLTSLTLTANVPVSLVAKTFVDANINTGTDRITIASHLFETGCPVYLTSVSATVPGGLTYGAIYYVIKIDANTIQLATTYALAIATTAIDITSAATGTTMTLDPQMITKFSNNSYKNNKASSVDLEATGSSIVYSNFTDRVAASPATTTDNAISRYNGTDGRAIQNSLATVEDDGSVAIPADTSFKSSVVGSMLTYNSGSNYVRVGSTATPGRVAGNPVFIGDDLTTFISSGGKINVDATMTGAGTTGAQTINKISGSVNFAAAAASLVVTNNKVTTASIIICTVMTNDATLTSVQAVAAAGSFTLFANAAATAETKISFFVVN